MKLRITSSFLGLFIIISSLQVWGQSYCPTMDSADTAWMNQIATDCAWLNSQAHCPGGLASAFLRTIPGADGNGFFFGCIEVQCNGEQGFGSGEYFNVPKCGTDNPTVRPTTPPGSCPVKAKGSIIFTNNQVLGEEVPVVGTKFSLMYFSDRVVGRLAASKVVTHVTGYDLKSEISAFQVKVYDPSGTLVQTNSYANTTANQRDTYTWTTPQATWGTNNMTVEIRDTWTLGFTSVRTNTVPIGVFNAIKVGLGGWVPSVYHFYDVNSKILHLGDGSSRTVTATTISGGDLRIADENGSLVFEFNSSGKHLRTKTGVVGTTIYTFNYNGSGQLSSIVEPFSKTTTISRDGSGNFTGIVSPYGKTTTVTLDGNGYLASITNPNSEVYSATYNSSGLMLTFTKPNTHVATFTYDGEGLLIEDSSSGGSETTLTSVSPSYFQTNFEQKKEITSKVGRTRAVEYSIDRQGKEEQREIYPSGYVRNLMINYSGNSGSFDDGIVSGTNYYSSDSRFGNQVKRMTASTVAPTGSSFSTAYSESANLDDPSDPFSILSWDITSSDKRGDVTTTYDPSTKKYTSTTAAGKTSTVKTDAYERVIETKQGNQTAVSYTYTNEHLTAITQGARSTTLSYDSLTGLLTSITNALSQSTSFAYDSAERLITQVLPDMRSISFIYDTEGNLTSITPPSRPAHTFTIGSNEQLQSYNPPTLSGVPTVNTTYSYNLDKQLTGITRPDGTTLTLSYNATTGLKTSMAISSSFTDTYGYDAHGRLNNITRSDGSELDYDYYGNDLKKIDYTHPTSSTFNSKFEIDHETTYDLPEYERIVIGGVDVSTIYYGMTYERLNQAGSMTLSYSYPNGYLTGTTLSTTTDEYTYTAFGEMLRYRAKRNASNYTYDLQITTRDDLGRITTKKENIAAAGLVQYDYTFDSAGRLTSVDKAGVTVATYSYDNNSNRTGGTIGGVSTVATYDDQDRMLTYNMFSYTYNANGDLATKTNTLTSEVWTYTYDALGNLTQVVLPNTDTITYIIDPAGNRRQRKYNSTVTNTYIYDDKNRIIGETNSSGVLTRRYIYGSKGNIPDYFIDVSASLNYRIYSDHLGSPRVVVRVSNGSVQYKMDHDEFGRVTMDTIPGYLPFGFAGGLYDKDTGLVRFGARDYDAYTGRWTSKDPIRFDAGDTNLFGYVWNDPINWIDPTGLAGRSFGQQLNDLFADTFAYFGDPNAIQYQRDRKNEQDFNRTMAPIINDIEWKENQCPLPSNEKKRPQRPNKRFRQSYTAQN